MSGRHSEATGGLGSESGVRVGTLTPIPLVSRRSSLIFRTPRDAMFPGRECSLRYLPDLPDLRPGSIASPAVGLGSESELGWGQSRDSDPDSDPVLP